MSDGTEIAGSESEDDENMAVVDEHAFYTPWPNAPQSGIRIARPSVVRINDF